MSLFPIVVTTETERISSGTKQIGRGISMRWSGNAINLTANIDVSGDAHDAAKADQVKRCIQRHWNASFGGGYSVTCQVNMVVGNDSASDRSHIYIETTDSASHVNTFPTLYYATMTLAMPAAVLDWTPAHEFGHMLGLDDRYSEPVRSRVANICNGTEITKKFCGGTRTSDVDPGYNGNMMGSHLGKLEQRNLEDLLQMHATRGVMPGSSRPPTA